MLLLELYLLKTIDKKNAQARNRTGGPTMATLDFTTKPLALIFLLVGEKQLTSISALSKMLVCSEFLHIIVKQMI